MQEIREDTNAPCLFFLFGGMGFIPLPGFYEYLPEQGLALNLGCWINPC